MYSLVSELGQGHTVEQRMEMSHTMRTHTHTHTHTHHTQVSLLYYSLMYKYTHYTQAVHNIHLHKCTTSNTVHCMHTHTKCRVKAWSTH